jgi:vacuolar iron transporter family protein
MSSLSRHLSTEHKLSPSAQYISEIVYGGIDGIITTFAVVAGFAGAWSESAIAQVGSISVVLFGLANLMGDGVSMALGKYLSTKSEQDVYMTAWKKEEWEIKHNLNMEVEESIEIMTQQWMAGKDASDYITIIQKYPVIRTKWMMDNELEMADVRGDNAILQGFITLVSFVFFGFIPLIPYVFNGLFANGWITSVVMTGIALFALWVVRWWVTRMNFAKTVLQIVILGGVAAAVAYYTGDLVMKRLG